MSADRSSLFALRSPRASDALADEAKAQGILKRRDFDRFDSVATVDFWARLARILADELEQATRLAEISLDLDALPEGELERIRHEVPRG